MLTNLVAWLFTGTGSDRFDTLYAVVAADAASGNFYERYGERGTDAITVTSYNWRDVLVDLHPAPASTAKTFKAISLGFDSRVSSLNGPGHLGTGARCRAV